MSSSRSQSQSQYEAATFAARLLTFALSLAVIGAFFLPWVRLDGSREIYSGVQLAALAVSPIREYISAVAPTQTAVLLGGPLAMLLFAAIVATRYARRRTAILPTAAVLASAIAVSYGTTDLVADGSLGASRGLTLIAALSVVLLVHQLLIKSRSKLKRSSSLYKILSVATGSGRYRWKV